VLQNVRHTIAAGHRRAECDAERIVSVCARDVVCECAALLVHQPVDGEVEVGDGRALLDAKSVRAVAHAPIQRHARTDTGG